MTIQRCFLLMVLALACAACGRGDARPKGPLPLAELEAYRHCETDAQCTWVNNGCCDCANGGEDVAVATTKKAAFRALFECANAPCTAVSIEPECGTGTVACEGGLCVFHPQQ